MFCEKTEIGKSRSLVPYFFLSTAYMFQEGFGWTNGVFLTLVDRFPDLVPSSSSREQQTSSGHLDILWFRFRVPDINFVPLQDIFYFLNAVSVKFYDRWNVKHNSRFYFCNSIDVLGEIVFPYSLLENTYSTLSRKFNMVHKKLSNPLLYS